MALDQDLRTLQAAYEEFKGLNERLNVLKMVRAQDKFYLVAPTATSEFRMTAPIVGARAVVDDEIARITALRRQVLVGAKDIVLSILDGMGP